MADRYQHAQCVVIGAPEQRKCIYMPRSLTKLRQGFGRLMRKESDRGCVFLLGPRVHDPRHRSLIKELPLRLPDTGEAGAGSPYIRGETDRCLRGAFAHMGMLAEITRRGLDQPFSDDPGAVATDTAAVERPKIPESDLSY